MTSLLLSADRKVLNRVLSFLSFSDIKSLSLTCKAFNEKVILYLKDDCAWQRLLLNHFFIDRKLNGKTFFESFKAIDMYCSQGRNFQSDISSSQFKITSELTRQPSILLQNDNSLNLLLRAFGHNRKPSSVEMLGYFAAKCLAQYFSRYNQLLKKQVESDPRSSTSWNFVSIKGCPC